MWPWMELESATKVWVMRREEMSKKVREMNSAPSKESDGSARGKRRAADDGNGEEEGAQVEAKTSDEVR